MRRDRHGDRGVRDHLICATARLIGRRRTAVLTVREIANEAEVADGVLYNHFANKEQLLVHAVDAYTRTVVERTIGRLQPAAGRGTVEENLRAHLNRSVELLTAIMPIFAGLLSRPSLLPRFAGTPTSDAHRTPLSAALANYLREEQRLGRIADIVNADAAATMIIGACHDLVLLYFLHSPSPATVDVPPGCIDDLITALWRGIAPVRHTSDPS